MKEKRICGSVNWALPSDWVNSDGAWVHQVLVKEDMSVSAVQVSHLDAVKAGVRPVHVAAQEVDGYPLWATQTW